MRLYQISPLLSPRVLASARVTRVRSIRSGITALNYDHIALYRTNTNPHNRRSQPVLQSTAANALKHVL